MTRSTATHLCVGIDVWSRRIAGWAVLERESADHAAALIRNICAETGVDSAGLVLHPDSGKPMRGSTMTTLLGIPNGAGTAKQRGPGVAAACDACAD